MPADFSRAASLATRLLLRQRLYSLKIDVAALVYDKNIIFDSYKNFCRNSRATLNALENNGDMRDGCTIIRSRGGGAVYIVLYNDRIKSRGRRSFTLAHEVGHIYLGHERDGPDDEAEANHFAAQLLLPSALVYELLKHHDFKLTPDELALIFGVSKQAAATRLKQLSRVNDPEFSADELSLLKKLNGFLPYFDGPLIDY